MKVVLQQVLHLANVRLSKSVSNQLKAEYQDPIYICELTKDITRWAVMLRPCVGPGKFSTFTVVPRRYWQTVNSTSRLTIWINFEWQMSTGLLVVLFDSVNFTVKVKTD